MVDAAEDEADVHALSAQAQTESAAPDQEHHEDVRSAPAGEDDAPADPGAPLNPA